MKVYIIEAIIVKIKKEYMRAATPDEVCTRPEHPHPLMKRVLLGLNLLEKLPTNEYEDFVKIK